MRTGRTSSGPTTAITATTPARRSSGKPPVGEDVSIGLGPLRVDDSTKDTQPRRREPGRQEVARQSHDGVMNIRHDHEREQKSAHEDAPKSGPTRKTVTSACATSWSIGRRFGHHGRQTGGTAAAPPLRRPAAPSAWLGRREQRQPPRRRVDAACPLDSVPARSRDDTGRLPGQARTEPMTPRVKEGKGSEHPSRAMMLRTTAAFGGRQRSPDEARSRTNADLQLAGRSRTILSRCRATRESRRRRRHTRATRQPFAVAGITSFVAASFANGGSTRSRIGTSETARPR
jgi:hypothetical protein